MLEGNATRSKLATILPSSPAEPELWEYWLAVIRDIRCRDDKEVWVCVQWYYSANDVGSMIKSFDVNSCGKYERILSDHFDYIHCNTLEDVATVRRYEEAALEPDDIYDDFFCRYDLEKDARTLSPKQGSYTCLCYQPYSPDDSSTLMHFCPRPSCRKAYHHTCLLNGKHKETGSSLTTRPLRLLCVSPDSDEDFSLASALGSRRRRKNNASETTELSLRLSQLPPSLVRVAQRQIIKGAKFEAGGVTGNVKDVVRARRLVYDALIGNPIPDDWEDSINIEKVLAKIPGQKLYPFVCPSCAGPI